MSLPKTIKVATSLPQQKSVEVKEFPLPEVADDHVLVKVHSAGVNPTDWKHTYFGLSKEGSFTGCDYAGEVVQVGSKAKNVKVGDRLAGFIHGNKDQKEGAFAEYTPADPAVSFHIPQHVSYDEAAGLPIPFFTAAHALFRVLGLSESKQKDGEWVLVWSGATAVGFNTIQLLKLHGYKVVTTAGPANHDLLKSLGADLVFDYKDKDVSTKIKEATGDSVAYAIDTISEDDTVNSTAQSLGKNGGKVVLTLWPDTSKTGRNDVHFETVLLYTAIGKEIHVFGKHFDAHPDHRSFHERWQKVLENILEKKELKFLNTESRGGLKNGVSSAYADMSAGKNRATKYVVHPQEA